MKKYIGFTMVELLVALVIVGILTAIAIPTYRSQLTKARRTDGKTALMDLAARMERYYAQNYTFATATIASNPATDVLSSSQSPDGNYTLSITAKTATTFTIRATPQGTQATYDTLCGSLQLDNLGQRSITGTGTVAQCF